MKKIVGFISLLCMLNVVAVAGLVGFLWMTGRLDKPKVQAIGDLLKHQGTPDKFREKLYDIIEPTPTTKPANGPTTAPAASQPALADGVEPATADDRIDYVRRTMEVERLKLEAEAQSLRDRQQLLQTKQRELEMSLTKLAEDKKVFEQKMAATAVKDDGEGFKKSMALYDELKPKQVKELLNGMSAENAAKYLSAMEADRAAKIVGEFKTVDEKAFVKSVLERIQAGSKGSGTGAASAGVSIPGAEVSTARANPTGSAVKAGP